MDYMDVSPKQVVSAATACIPFLKMMTQPCIDGCEHATSSSALMNPEAPFVGTGMEHVAARDSGAAITAKHRGRVEHVESNEILVRRLVEETVLNMKVN